MLAALRALFPSTATFPRIGYRLKLATAVAFAVVSIYAAYAQFRELRSEAVWLKSHPVLCVNTLSQTVTPLYTLEYKEIDETGVWSNYQRYWAVPGDHCVYVLEYKEQEQEWQ